MSDSPQSVVRRFFAAWADPKPDELGGFFDDAAVWVDGPQGVRCGADAIKSALSAQLKVTQGVKVNVKTLVTDGGTVMVEQVSNSSFGGNPISGPSPDNIQLVTSADARRAAQEAAQRIRDEAPSAAEQRSQVRRG